MTWLLHLTRDVRDVLLVIAATGLGGAAVACVIAAADAVRDELRRDDDEPVPDDRAMDVVTDAMRPERWQDEACAMTAPDDQPIVPRPQPDISSAAQRYGAEVEAYLKEFSS